MFEETPIQRLTGLTTVVPGVTILTWLVGIPAGLTVWTVGVAPAIEKTTFAGGGRIPSMVNSCVAKECRNNGKLFWKRKSISLKIIFFTFHSKTIEQYIQNVTSIQL